MEEIKVENKLEDITGFTCVYVPVSDVYKAAQWYETNLGCKLREGDIMEPGMTGAIMRFPDANGNPHGPTGPVPAMFLLPSGPEGGRLGFTWPNGERQAVGCFITPRIQKLFERFKSNGVNIVDGIRVTCGPNLQFYDPDGNMWEVWEPSPEEINFDENAEDITGICCFYVPVRDVYETAQWYETNLGCKLREGDKMEPGMTGAIMRFPDHTGKTQPFGKVPAMFLLPSGAEGGRLGFSWPDGDRQAVGCFITPRIQELFDRFKKNRVSIVDDIRITCGPNLQFYDPEGNMWEIWQP